MPNPTPNLALPGNPRYQPEELKPYFGYDNNYKFVAEVEISTMRALASIGIIPSEEIALLTPEVEQRLLAITTSEVVEMEKITKHDIRAWVKLAKQVLHPSLGRWLHVPLTSYDALDTARILQFVRAHREVVKPFLSKAITQLATRTVELSDVTQIGRTHGQHALPITVGFWLAGILQRVVANSQRADRALDGLVGKISGAVGAYNAQVALGMTSLSGQSFEAKVLGYLGLSPAPISTQILQPEPLAEYLFACSLLSATFAQLGCDARHLMRTELGELCEPFDKGQVGSSTMAHKRNPVNFENLQGTWIKTKNEFGNVLDTLISEHQRDLTGSCVARDYPTIVVNLVMQLNTLLRAKQGQPSFLERITVDQESCGRNLALQGDEILAEPIYIALQMAGYVDDAHKLINECVIPRAQELRRKGQRVPLLAALKDVLDEVAPAFGVVWNSYLENMSLDRYDMLSNPRRYVGHAKEKAREIAENAKIYVYG